MHGRQLDGKPRGGTSSRRSKKRIIEWVKAEAKLKGLVGTTPKVSHAKSLNAGKEASTADVDQALEDYINEQRKEHRGCGSAEVMNNLLEITPDALGALHANATTKDAEEFRARSCLLYTSPSPRDKRQSRMPSSA